MRNTSHSVEDEAKRSEREARKRRHWCKRCSRYHPKDAICKLVRVEVEAKSGQKVQRLVSP